MGCPGAGPGLFMSLSRSICEGDGVPVPAILDLVTKHKMSPKLEPQKTVCGELAMCSLIVWCPLHQTGQGCIMGLPMLR